MPVDARQAPRCGPKRYGGFSPSVRGEARSVAGWRQDLVELEVDGVWSCRPGLDRMAEERVDRRPVAIGCRDDDLRRIGSRRRRRAAEQVGEGVGLPPACLARPMAWSAGGLLDPRVGERDRVDAPPTARRTSTARGESASRRWACSASNGSERNHRGGCGRRSAHVDLDTLWTEAATRCDSPPGPTPRDRTGSSVTPKSPGDHRGGSEPRLGEPDVPAPDAQASLVSSGCRYRARRRSAPVTSDIATARRRRGRDARSRSTRHQAWSSPNHHHLRHGRSGSAVMSRQPEGVTTPDVPAAQSAWRSA